MLTVKNQFVQSLKGLCIIFVVMIHLPWGTADNWSVWIWIGVRQIINFAVATFFFLSAYYSKKFNDDDEFSVSHYYGKRMTRLLVPYVIWTSVYVFVIPILTTGQIDSQWLFHMLTGKGPTYFLLALAQFTLLLPLLQRYKSHRWLNVLFWLITPAYLTFYYSYNLTTGEEFRPEQFFCFPWFACYYMGLKMQNQKFSKRICNISVVTVLFVTIIILAVSIVEAAFIYHYTNIMSFAISQITFGSVAYSLIVIILFTILWHGDSQNNKNWLSSIGDYSMGIFLMHPFFNWFFKYIAIHIPGGVVWYSTSYGMISVHIAILVLSVSASYFVSQKISKTFPQLVNILGLK